MTANRGATLRFPIESGQCSGGIPDYDHGIMTMLIKKAHMKTMASGSFKVHCLEEMDEVQAKRDAIVITKLGKPLVTMVTADNDACDNFGFLADMGRANRDSILTE